MEIYLIRHTTPKIEKGICYGQSDIPLAPSFELEAQKIIQENTFLDSDCLVYSSPLQRCRLLAQKLFPRAKIVYDNRLKELDFGVWELQAWNEINPSELQVWMDDFVKIRCPKGESYTDLNHRVIDFKQSLKINTPTKIAIITHAGVIRAFLAQHNNIALKDSFQYKVPYGVVTVIS
ncbi:alpha-ribazole phosphatase family protein [Salegentibacter flavus]|uniref:Alpha-ribazole phosphatase n=1 Tax=Salegentibacter flavus TaxID=287099 RepID=A0A1I5DA88_9FLAO|nr:alpha-ribazole phosphatase family protein [Salegentibacter flavus]SFN96169.1 alpha-ribazole phosphatase [Salegentibacter flavus]